MANIINFNVCVDLGVRHIIKKMYSELGVDLNTAINVFLRQSLHVGGFPFDVNEMMQAMLEAERIGCDSSVKRYSDVEEALKVLKER